MTASNGEPDDRSCASQPTAAELRAQVAELRAQVAELSEAVRARDAFISVVGHELRNPMTPIRAQVDLLLRLVREGRAAPERLQVGLERVGWLVERYIGRATTLLDVSRATAGRLSLSPQQVHLATLLREVTACLTPLAAHAGSELVLEASDAISGNWDPLALEQIVENLLTNAVKYGAGKPIEITAEAHAGQVLLCVRDHGIGISEVDRARIFERFERVVGGDTAGGFGIGLWLVRQLVEAMGGTIRVDGTADKGTTFTVALPLGPQGAK